MSDAVPAPPSVSLWRHRDFLILWTGETVSGFGSQVTSLALPLTAIVVLHASPGQMAVLATVGSLPNVLFGLLAGVWADRAPRRPLLIWTNVGRAVLLATIPLAATVGRLSLAQLYVVAFASATLGTVFGPTYAGILPSLVKPRHLVEANSKLQMSNYLARITGPGLTGILVQLLTAPITIVLDAVSYLATAGTLLLIRVPETSWREDTTSIWRDLGEGIAFVLKQPVVRAMMLTVGAANFFLGTFAAEQILFMTRDLHLAPGVLGWVLAIMGPSGLVGTLIAGRVAGRLRPGRAMIAGGLVYGVGALCLPLATGSRPETIAIVALGLVLMGLGSPSYYINFVSLTQVVTPSHLLGRANTFLSLVMTGTTPFGALAGGAVAQMIGVRFTLLGVGCGVILAFAALLGSSVYSYRE